MEHFLKPTPSHFCILGSLTWSSFSNVMWKPIEFHEEGGLLLLGTSSCGGKRLRKLP